MPCIRKIRRACIFYLKLSATLLLLAWIIRNQFPKQYIGSTFEKSSQVHEYIPTVATDVYWGDYYRKVITNLNLEPYKFHMNTSCSVRFHDKIENNMKTVLDYPVVRPMKTKYAQMFDDFDKPVVRSGQDENFPVIVTAASSNHYTEAVRMIKSVQKTLMSRYSGIKLVFFDLGLTAKQRKQLETFCKCEIRNFSFHDYPPFVSKLTNYVWKPLIIYKMLKEYNFITWADSSIIFHGSANATDVFFQRAKEVGILITKVGCECRSFQNTKLETFKYLNETVCLFELFQLEATFITIWKTTFTWKYVIQPWIACALTENCMSHPSPLSVLYCINRRPYHKCHRFDQSVLSIILQRLFNANYDIITLNKIEPIARIERLF